MSNTKINIDHKVFSLKKDTKVKRLAVIWIAAAAALILIGSQIITFNQSFFLMRPDTVGMEWFTPVYTSMAIGFPVAAMSFLGYHLIKKDSKISDNTYNVLRLTGFTIIASTGLIYVLAPVVFGTFLPYILGDFTTLGNGAIPAGYAIVFPTLFIGLVMPAPILGLGMSTIKVDWIKINNETYIKTRNWFLASSALSYFLLPLTIAGQGIWMLDATGVNPSNWQSNMFFAVHVGGQIGLFVVYAISILNKNYYKKLGTYKKYSRIKNQYLAVVGAIIVSGSAIWFIDTFVVSSLYPPQMTVPVWSLGKFIPQDLVFAEFTILGINHIDITAGKINELFQMQEKQGIYMGGGFAEGHWYYIAMFLISALSTGAIIGLPIIDYLFGFGKQQRINQ